MKNKYKILTILIGAIIVAACGKSGEPKNDNDATPKSLAPQEFSSTLESIPDAILLDVRKPDEVEEGMIQGAINIDYTNSDFVEKIDLLDSTKTYFLYCKTAKRSAGAADQMKKMGFKNIYILEGGINNWQTSGLEIVKPK